MVMNKIKTGLRILYNPKTEFEALSKRTFESVINEYIFMIFFLGILTGLFSLLVSVIKAFYYNLVLHVDINFLRMLNYEVGRSVSIMFLYFFVGTFGIFFLSLILNWIFKNIKYTEILKVIFYSLWPLLLFSWIPFSPVFLFVWSIFLFVIGIKSYKNVPIKKDSIHQRH